VVEFAALAAFIAAALPIGIALARGAQAVFLAAVVTGVAATFAGMLHVWLDVPITLVWLVLVLACDVAVVAIRPWRRHARANLRAGVTRDGVLQLVIAGTVAVLALSLAPAPLGWDARSIWLFHASWLNAPASVFIDEQSLPAAAFSHPNYPIIGPGSTAVVWGIAGGTENLMLGVQVTGLLTVMVLALGASLILARFARGASPIVTNLAFAGYLTAGLAIADGSIVRGYMDTLQAAAITTLVAALVTSSPRRPTVPSVIVTVMIALCAINVKQEGFWFAIAVLAIFLVLSIRQQSVGKYVPLAGVLAFYLLWKAFLGSTGSDDVSDASGIATRAGELLEPNSTAWSIFARVATNEFLGLPSTAIAVSLVLLVAVLVARRNRRMFSRVALIAAAPLATSLIVITTYALGDTRDRIDWWLATSFSRIIATSELLAWFGIFFAVLLLSPWRRRTNC
jgi:hypothetical protein